MDRGGNGLCEGSAGAVTSRDNLSQFYEQLVQEWILPSYKLLLYQPLHCVIYASHC